MEIEIITTKKKLSKALVNQMQLAGKHRLAPTMYEVLGFVHNVVKNVPRCAIIKSREQYFLVPLNFKKLGKCVSRPLPKHFKAHVNFDTEEECDAWWVEYEKIKRECLNNQIYL